MAIPTIDLSEYLQKRSRMRLLPNLLDLGMAWALVRPIFQIDNTVIGRTLERSLQRLIDSSSLGFIRVAIGYLVYALTVSVFQVLIAAKLKSLVLSDSRGSLIAIASYFLLTGIYMSGVTTELTVVNVAIALSGTIYVYAALSYNDKIKSLERDPIYRHLAGIKRQSLPYARIRYGFLSPSQ